METVTMDDEALTADSHDSHDSDSDSDANSNSNSDHSSLLNPLVPFQENSQELAMAQTEEEELRRLANERMVGQVDPIVVKALELAKKVEEEKLNDHGKPWKEPPPVEFGTQYWKNWRERIKIDKSEVETPEQEAERHRKAELLRRKSRPGLRDPLPPKKNRHGASYNRCADFSPMRYNESYTNNPRIIPPKQAKSSALRTVESMMKNSGLTHPDDVLLKKREVRDRERQRRREELLGKEEEEEGGGEIIMEENEILEEKEIKKEKTGQKLKPIPQRAPSFPVSTRNDWSKVTSVDMKPTASKSDPGGNYDVENASKIVLKRNRNCNIFGKQQNKPSMITPGPIYEPKLNSLSNKIFQPPVKFSTNPRFKISTKPVAESGEFGAEAGPQSYNIKSDLLNKEARAFDGLTEFDSMKKTDAPKLRAMASFGFGCNLQEHILYGQCLNGKCSTRSPWEKFNSTTINHWRKRDKKIKVRGEEKKDAQRTALHFAVLYGDLDLVHSLCLDGHDVDACDEDRKSPLHIAAEKGFTRILERLLNNGDFSQVLKIGYVSKRINPLIDEQDNDGHTPLHLASNKANKKCVELLIDAGANPDILNKKGLTALDVAGTQALFATLEYYCEISKERARQSHLKMKERQQRTVVRERERGASRQELMKSQSLKTMMLNEVGQIKSRASTMIQRENAVFE